MNIYECIERVGGTDKSEQPLDKILDDGGYTAIFRSIACVGDSLSSGTLEAVDEKETHTYHDCFEYSWGQYLSRMTGAKVYNFSCSGMTAMEYQRSFGNHINAWLPEKAAQAYILALGVNDLSNAFKHPLGSIEDIDLQDYTNNKPTFAGWYGKIVQRYKEIQPNAKFFFVSMPRSDLDSEEKAKERKNHAKLLHDMTKIFSNAYVIDLNQYAPVYDKEFREKFYLHGHLNPLGYQLTAKMIASYIDHIIRSAPKAFRQVGFIGKPQYSNQLDLE